MTPGVQPDMDPEPDAEPQPDPNPDQPAPSVLPPQSVVFLEESNGNAQAPISFAFVDLGSNDAAQTLFAPKAPTGNFVDVRAGDADLSPSRTRIAFAPAGQAGGIVGVGVDGTGVKALSAASGVGFSVFRTPRYAPNGNTILFAGGELDQGGAFESAEIYQISANGNRDTPRALDLSTGTCDVIRDPVFVSSDRIVAIRDVCAVASDGGVYQFQLGSGGATPLMTRTVANPDGVLSALDAAPGGGTVYALGAGRFDLTLDQNADVGGAGVFEIRLGADFVDVHGVDPPQSVLSFSATPNSDTLVFEIFSGGQRDLFEVDLDNGSAGSITDTGTARGPF